MPTLEKPAIVLAPYGSLSPRALATYERIQAAYEREFPGSQVLLAFTSQFMIKRLQEKEGITVASPLEALSRLHSRGCRSAVVQSLQIVPGRELSKLRRLYGTSIPANLQVLFDLLKRFIRCGHGVVLRRGCRGIPSPKYVRNVSCASKM